MLLMAPFPEPEKKPTLDMSGPHSSTQDATRSKSNQIQPRWTDELPVLAVREFTAPFTAGLEHGARTSQGGQGGQGGGRGVAARSPGPALPRPGPAPARPDTATTAEGRKG